IWFGPSCAFPSSYITMLGSPLRCFWCRRMKAQISPINWKEIRSSTAPPSGLERECRRRRKARQGKMVLGIR
ncbi:unnamed protein product, partial [Ectocarpus sp. 13 AM-2016]